MKRSVLIISIIIVVVIIFTIIALIQINTSKKININKEVTQKYTELKDDKFLFNELKVNNSGSIDINGESIMYNFNTGNFNYNNKEFTPLLAYDEPCYNGDCGISVYVVDFENFYLI